MLKRRYLTKLDIDPRLPFIQNADLEGKLVLVRGGRLILMTHIGRPRDKKTGRIKVEDDTSVQPVVEYLERKLYTKFAVPQFSVDPELGIREIHTSINWPIRDLRDHRIGGIYLPNTRWFEGEEGKGEKRKRFAIQLAGRGYRLGQDDICQCCHGPYSSLFRGI